MKRIYASLLSIVLLSLWSVQAQEPDFGGLKLRGIGPAFMSGRIADIAVHPDNQNIWYVAVGSGNVWKTENAGTTWTPIFDNQAVYSTGCITIDNQNPATIWLGTGENVGGRHVSFGDGIYKSTDNGNKWQNMGLAKSEHISKIIVHPKNSDIVWVAAQGPLWSKGGERGVYKTTNGGKQWQQVLGDTQWTGATDLQIDPRNPDVLYAATWQRHRTVAAYMGGGPGTAIYRSDDGGTNWKKLSKGLPQGAMGKIGLAVSPQKPDVVYAAIELDRRQGGVYRSENRGESWTKMSDAVSGATGPHYYQELYASPHQFDKLYLVDVYMQISDDGGRTFRKMNETHKHVDNHAVVFRKDDPHYLLVGTDGGLYETFDGEKNWRYVSNLPVTQFYKVAVDDALPFYNVYGGTQDNNTQGGPSRTANVQGIQNRDWEVVLFADGHQPATEPGNPAIVYAEWQEGNLMRTDRTTGELVYIQPQPAEGEDSERFNWDAPILVSPHKTSRIYFASHRVWRSENRGDSWKAISGDLTQNRQRIAEPIMGGTQSWDNAWDIYAMSQYSTITSLAESPVQEDLLYAGTDDGLIQVSEDGGNNWQRIEVSKLPGVPATAFVNDIKADLHDANTVYVALDNHKYGDFKPYLYVSNNKGKTWKSIAGKLPQTGMVWRMVQDHQNPQLLFAGTEFGLFFSTNAGTDWTQLKGGLPTIAFRDLAIQRRENDLIGATFGRGFYIFDDYSVLREASAQKLQQEAALFSVRDAWWYIPRAVLGNSPKGSQGAAHYTAPNPPFGAVFTYHLKDGYKTLSEMRKEEEKKKQEAGQSVGFPGWETVEKEVRENPVKLFLVVSDKDNNVIRRIEAPTNKGFHRVAWDLKLPAPQAIDVDSKVPEKERSGLMVAPGNYRVQLIKVEQGNATVLGQTQEFEVKPLHEGALKGASPDVVAEFWSEIQAVQTRLSVASAELGELFKKTKALELALKRSATAPGAADKQVADMLAKLNSIDIEMNGYKSKKEVGAHNKPSVSRRLSVAITGTVNSTYGPTPTHKASLEIAQRSLDKLESQLKQLRDTDLANAMQLAQEAGAPPIVD